MTGVENGKIKMRIPSKRQIRTTQEVIKWAHDRTISLVAEMEDDPVKSWSAMQLYNELKRGVDDMIAQAMKIA